MSGRISTALLIATQAALGVLLVRTLHDEARQTQDAFARLDGRIAAVTRMLEQDHGAQRAPVLAAVPQAAACTSVAVQAETQRVHPARDTAAAQSQALVKEALRDGRWTDSRVLALREHLPALDAETRAQLMEQIVQGLQSGQMQRDFVGAPF